MSLVEFLEIITQLMDQIQVLAKTHIHWAPFIIAGALLLAGFNLPISEDLMIFITAMIAVNNPNYAHWLYLGLIIGALGSDMVAYWTGRLLGPQLFNIPLFKRLLTKEKLHRMASFYNRYGMGVILIGRFIPFGVRNLMFITAGLGKSHFGKFTLADLLAVFISVTTYFLLFYYYGEAVLDVIRRFNIFLFSAFIIGLIVYFVLKKYSPLRQKNKKLATDREIKEISLKKTHE